MDELCDWMAIEADLVHLIEQGKPAQVKDGERWGMTQRSEHPEQP